MTPDSDDGGDEDEDFSGTLPSLLGEGQTFKDMLSHGVVVTLDGVAWSRIVAHVSDDADDSEGAGNDDQDDEGEWEDDSDQLGQDAEEAVGNTSGTVQQSARRRKGLQRGGYSGVQVGESTKSSRVGDKQQRSHKWDRERAVVVVYDLDPSKEHEIELQIVGLSGEIKESSECTLRCPTNASSGFQHCPRTSSIPCQQQPAPTIACKLITFTI